MNRTEADPPHTTSPVSVIFMQPLRISLLRDWMFRTDGGDEWQPAELPHCPFIPDPDRSDYWQGVCTYRRIISIPDPQREERLTVYFHGAMETAKVYIDGQLAGSHAGGYLPFEIDLSHILADGNEHALLVELDNRDNADVPPGKPHRELDFCKYGGLYRDVELRRYPAIHITDAATANEVAGGGIFVRTLQANEQEARLLVRVHVRSLADSPHEIQLEAYLRDRHGQEVGSASTGARLPPEADTHLELELNISQPTLWSPADPHLHDLGITLKSREGTTIDHRRERLGIREIHLSRSGGFRLNGKRIRPRGTNRHQDYPWVGYALPEAAHRRDARLIKEAGFDYVRLSHYPQSPHFLDACDELGILVMNCLPGWQFIGGETFRIACYDQARRLIRRDRNHPCVVLWELSLNETVMDEPFMDRLHEIGHEELPGEQTYICGWIDRYDVFLHARQHGRIHTWANGDKPLVVSEYGDWEFYAQTEGFDQKSGRGLLDPSKNSRVLRRDGEVLLRQQACNHALALNDTLASPAASDGLWSMFDYPRGYDPVRAACGIADFFRLPKFSYHFYRSQRDPHETGVGWRGGPSVFIASYWTSESPLEVWVFSNTQTVELRLNGRTIERLQPARAKRFRHLPHPPFIFILDAFEPGTLEAIGFQDREAVASHRVVTPGAPSALRLRLDDDTRPTRTDERDLRFVRVEVADDDGNPCVHSEPPVTLTAQPSSAIVSPSTTHAEAGIASFLIRRPADGEAVKLQASSTSLRPAKLEW